MSGIIVGGATLAAGGLNYLASDKASDAASTAAKDAAAISDRQFQQTREDLMPFLEAATGKALPDFLRSINNAPRAPQLQALDAQTDFEFDPQSVLDNPNFQFLREQGDIAASRAAASNRLLGSGNRLIEAQERGQGLASRFLGDEFNRQSSEFANRFNRRADLNRIENNRLLTQHALGLDAFNSRLNRLSGLIDVGSRTGSSLGTAGAQNASTTGQFLQNAGNARAAGILGQTNALTGTINQGAQLFGMGAFNRPQPTAAPATSIPGFTPIGPQDARGFFS